MATSYESVPWHSRYSSRPRRPPFKPLSPPGLQSMTPAHLPVVTATSSESSGTLAHTWV
ncbi:hypothetical protein KL940_005430, partial [Ogataea angusta]